MDKQEGSKKQNMMSKLKKITVTHEQNKIKSVTGIKNEITESFKAKEVGRGIWFVITTLISSLILNKSKENDKTLFHKMNGIYISFIIYCKYIYCGHCRDHAAIYIKEHPMSDKLNNTSGIISLFNWIYNFHKSANEKRPNNDIKTPDIVDVKNYYLDGYREFSKSLSMIKDSDFEYNLIEKGIWHYFFLLITKCTTRSHINLIYYLILEFMPNLPHKQYTLFYEFCNKHRFTEALNDDTITDDYLIVCLFDWFYSMYSFINTKSDLTVYSKENLRQVYFYLDVCREDCDK